MIRCFVVDVDGVLACSRHRDERTEQWLCSGDLLCTDNYNRIMYLYEEERNSYRQVANVRHEIIIVTGRHEHYRPDTISWLTRHQIWFDGLLMRRDNDRQPTASYKVATARFLQSTGRTIALAFDDRDDVIAGYRAEKIPTMKMKPPFPNESKKK